MDFRDVLVSMVSPSGLGNRSIKCLHFFCVWICFSVPDHFWNANIHYSRTKPNCSCLAMYRIILDCRDVFLRFPQSVKLLFSSLKAFEKKETTELMLIILGWQI